MVTAACVLMSPMTPEAGWSTEGKRALQARAAVLRSDQVPAAMGTWEERLVSNWWLGALGRKVEFRRNGDAWDRDYKKIRDFLQGSLKVDCMGIERRSRGLGARRLSFIKNQLCGVVVE